GGGGSEADSEVKVWEARTGVEALTLRGHVGRLSGTVAFSPDGHRLATGGGSLDGTVKLWDLSTGQETLTLRGHANAVNTVAFSRDGNRIVSASADRSVRVWNGKPFDGEEGEELHTLTGHKGGVRGVAFHPDGHHLASVGDDGTVRVWELKLPGVVNFLRSFDGHMHGFGKTSCSAETVGSSPREEVGMTGIRAGSE